MIIFGLNETGKRLKRALETTGANPQVIKPWLKKYNQIRRAAAPTEAHYQRVKKAVEQVREEAEQLEQQLIHGTITGAEERKAREIILAHFKGCEAQLDYEFLVGTEDRDFHLTLQAIVTLGQGFPENGADPLLLQSEVENLLAMAAERLSREQPEPLLLACFYLDHKDRELEGMSASSQILYLEECFRREFAEPVMEEMKKALAKAPDLQKELEQGSGRRRKKAESLKLLTVDFPEILAEEGLQEAAVSDQVTAFLRKLCNL